jgi:Tfp pilus assembly PilM family ATPase
MACNLLYSSAMAKTPTHVVGIDLGRHALKAAALTRRGANRFVLNGYAIRPVEGALDTPDQVARQVQALLGEMGGGAPQCAVAVSSPNPILRIIEQPETPTHILREALRLNGMALLNQEVREFVLDCDLLHANGGAEAPAEPGGVKRLKYLVGGIPRSTVGMVDAGFQKIRKCAIHSLQLPPVCSFNAFEFSNPETYANDAFILVDIGHSASTLIVGVKKELILVRSIDFCGQFLLNAIMSQASLSEAETIRALTAGSNPQAVETMQLVLTALTREISSSIGFFEGRREETIKRIFLSGGMARSRVFLESISGELNMPCVSWDPFQNCEIALPAARKQTLPDDLSSLTAACGAAMEILKG